MINNRDITVLPPYRNLILGFRGEENLRARIDIHLDRGEEGQDSWIEGISWSAVSLSFR
jgi:hypothetical protein